MSAGRVFPPNRLAHLDPLISRLSTPRRAEGHIAFQPQSAVIQPDGGDPWIQ